MTRHDLETVFAEASAALAELQASREVPLDVVAEDIQERDGLVRIRFSISGEPCVLEIDREFVEDYLPVLDDSIAMPRIYRDNMCAEWREKLRSFLLVNSRGLGENERGEEDLASVRAKRLRFLEGLYRRAGGNTNASIHEYALGDDLGLSHHEVDLVEGHLVSSGMIRLVEMGVDPRVSITATGITELEREAVPSPNGSAPQPLIAEPRHDEMHEDVIDVKPNFCGIGINVNALLRRVFRWIRQKRGACRR